MIRAAVFSVLLAILADALAQTTVTLQEGLNGYVGTGDTAQWNGLPDSNDGANPHFGMNWSTSNAFVRFKIFASEGGPVPAGATITSATLSLHKREGPDSVFEARRLLKDWKEMEATWNIAAAGLPWQTPGAQGAADVAPSADGQAAVATGAAWLDINVTSGVTAFAGGTANYGWRINWVTGTTGAKSFISRNNGGSPSLRPKLTITYTTSSPTACGSGTLRPYSGSPIQINANGTTEFEAEHFNCGGQGVAYHDTTAGPNAGQTFRADESVDIIGAPTGMAVNNFNAGEWMIYTINVQTAGTYDLGIVTSAAASGGTNRAFRFEINGTDVTGPVDVPVTNDWNDYQLVLKSAAVNLNPGQYQLKLVSVAQYFRIDKIHMALSIIPPTGCNEPPSRPYDQLATRPIAISATGTTTFEAEHFNCGGQGHAYNELPGNNNPGQTFRTGEAVDIVDITAGRAVNELETGEWLEYTLNIPAGTYQVAVLAASSWTESTPQVRLDLNGQLVGTVGVFTGAFGTYDWFTAGTITVPASAEYKLQLVSASEHFRVDKIRLVAPTPPEEEDGGGNEGGAIYTDPCPAGLEICSTFDQATTTTHSGGHTGEMRAEGLSWWANNANDSTTEPVLSERRVWLQNQYVRHGTHALLTMNRRTDYWKGDSSQNERSEMELAAVAEPTDAVHGQTQWWAHSVFFPPEFLIRAEDGSNFERTVMFLQFHAAGTNPAIALEVYGQLGTSRRKVFAVSGWGPKSRSPDVSGRQYEYVAPGDTHARRGACFEKDVEEGVWYDFVHKIVWANNGTGEHHIWLRKGGSNTVTKVLSKTGISLVYPANWSGTERTYAFLKIGNYQTPVVPGAPGERLKKDANGNYLRPPPGSADEFSSAVIHDRIRRGGNYADVRLPDFPATEAQLPNPPTIKTCNDP